ncbi:hypothetical protein [Leptolyngbya sp. AN02str]|uniref:hypothetical protein n=1 Tax=Leptolyngbya sp. AN02str TaxID=3423363 RepID=UPI003D315BF7
MTSETAQILAALTQQQQTLEMIQKQLHQPPLGFSDAVGIVYVFCNRQHGSLWYRLDANGDPIAICHTALTGYLTSLEFPRVERRNKEVIKLQATIKADTTYVLEAGYESQFAKGLLSAIAHLTPEELKQPITVVPQAGEDDKVLFCRVFHDGEFVRAHYDDTTDWRRVAATALSSVKVAIGSDR